MAYEPERFAARPEGAYAMNINEFMKEVFKFEDKQVKIIGTYEEPWFCGRDVCRILEYSNYRKAIHDHVYQEDKKDLYELIGVPKMGTPPDLTHNEKQQCYINESGLYTLVLKSKLPSANKFQRWITKDVIPELRKRGGCIKHRLLI